MTPLNRRQFIAAAGGFAGAAASGVLLGGHVWPLLTKEDLIPGTAPQIDLVPNAWTTTSDRLRFAALGDNGSGGRQAMAVARQMAETYAAEPVRARLAARATSATTATSPTATTDVFRRPMPPLIDAGVGFELAIGNHDAALALQRRGPRGDREPSSGCSARRAATTRPHTGRPTSSTSTPACRGSSGPARRPSSDWLDDTLASADQPVEDRGAAPPALLVGPPRLHGRRARSASSRSSPVTTSTSSWPATTTTTSAPTRQAGITYVVSGGGCKTTSVGRQLVHRRGGVHPAVRPHRHRRRPARPDAASPSTGPSPTGSSCGPGKADETPNSSTRSPRRSTPRSTSR